MAWITKDSATQQIERRDEPYLSDEMTSYYTDSILPRYANKRAALLPILHDVQHHVGYLPFQALEEIATFLELTAAEVLDTASFYDDFFLEPVGKHVIGVCQSIACEACGHETMLGHLCSKLNIEPGETTPDGLFTVRTMECLGSCDTAPCALFGEERQDDLTVEKIDALIDKLSGDA
ncbi:MAG: NADH-quinone oxidoreductase subunit NuoE [Planctomycetes bacterium]|nr:NADH-quinone oxidoreductase subunit NuoE [Planctomycetota bacterium]NOG54088.1 NADH-quinone oxidoreductase subunit NuoE [Planctomycetota bacterium]